MRRTWIVSTVVVAGAVVVGSLSRPQTVQGADSPAFVGPGACKACHIKPQHKTWKETGMAKTFESLKPGTAAAKKTAAKLDPNADFTKDEKCLKCHTTGFGQPTGYPKVEGGAAMTAEQQAAAKLTEGVTCEACHGPGSLYGPHKKENKEYKLADVAKLGLVSPPTAETCTPCHVKECPTMPADYAFKFEEAIKKKDQIHDHAPLKSTHK